MRIVADYTNAWAWDREEALRYSWRDSSLTQIMTSSHYQMERVVLLELDYSLHSYNTKEASSLTLDYLLYSHSWEGAIILTQIWLHILFYQ